LEVVSTQKIAAQPETAGASVQFLQARSAWHRGRNDGQTEMRFLAVFSGAKDVANVVNPPKGTAIDRESSQR